MGPYNNALRFPANSGLSGRAFTNGKIIYQNGERLEREFNDLDNIAGFAYIRSFVFIPLYGCGNRKRGVLQLYNKLDGEISKEDVKEYKLLQHTLGLTLENAIELNEALDYVLCAKSVTAKIMEHTTTDKNRENLVSVRVM